MDAAINQLIDLDKQARKMVEDATAYLNDTLAGIESQVDQFKKNYVEEASHRIQLIQEEEQALADENCRQLAQQYGQLRERMDQRFASCREDWEDQLFRRCTGR